MIKKLLLTLSRKTLLSIYKSFVRPNLDNSGKIYDKLFNESFKSKSKAAQYCAALVINGTFKGTSSEDFYKAPITNMS